MISLRCDVVMVGAGPAGSMAALAAAGTGAEVILLDQRREVGLPVRCAEYVPWQLAAHVPWSSDCVAQRVSFMRTHLPDGQVVESPFRGYVIHRQLFDQNLASVAQRAGARLLLRTKALQPTSTGLLARQDGREVHIEAKVIVGADGARSTVGGWIGQINEELIVAAQCTVILDRWTETTEVYFDPDYVGGYGWLFPKADVANVGVGLDHGHRPKEALELLLSRLSMEGRAIIGYTGGLIPSGGPLERTWQSNIVLVGDAAGQTHPITGAGVANACLCGHMAGQAAARAALEGDLTLLEGYEQEWRDFLGAVLAHAAAKRHSLNECWSDDPRSLSEALRQSWVAFPAYGQQVDRATLLVQTEQRG